MLTFLSLPGRQLQEFLSRENLEFLPKSDFLGHSYSKFYNSMQNFSRLTDMKFPTPQFLSELTLTKQGLIKYMFMHN